MVVPHKLESRRSHLTGIRAVSNVTLQLQWACMICGKFWPDQREKRL